MFGLMPRKRELAPREYRPLEAFRKEFESLFSRAFGSLPMMWEPEMPHGVEMEEGEKEVVARFELPGFELAELKVELRGSELKVAAEHKEPEKKETGEYRHYERSVTMPEGVETEKVEAFYKNGVLEVHMPRAPEFRPRVIEVKA